MFCDWHLPAAVYAYVAISSVKVDRGASCDCDMVVFLPFQLNKRWWYYFGQYDVHYCINMTLHWLPLYSLYGK